MSKQLADFPVDVLEAVCEALTARLAPQQIDHNKLATEQGRIEIAYQRGRESAIDEIRSAMNYRSKSSQTQSPPTIRPSLASGKSS